jgi:hypothetical protein
MTIDPDVGQMSLTGVFHTLFFGSFPSPRSPFTVYAALTDGVGEGVGKLAITRLDTNDTIYTHQRWFAFPSDRLVPVNMEIRVRACVFPVPGRYAVSLHFDDEVASERTLLVEEEPS